MRNRLPETKVVVVRDPRDETPRQVDPQQREDSRDRRRPRPVHARNKDGARALAVQSSLLEGRLMTELSAVADVYHWRIPVSSPLPNTTPESRGAAARPLGAAASRPDPTIRAGYSATPELATLGREGNRALEMSSATLSAERPRRRNKRIKT